MKKKNRSLPESSPLLSGTSSASRPRRRRRNGGKPHRPASAGAKPSKSSGEPTTRHRTPQTGRRLISSQGWENAEVALDLIDPFPLHPPRFMSEEGRKKLLKSIDERGVLNPVLLRPAGTPGRYEVLAGHHRVEAAKELGHSKIPARVKALSEVEASAVAVVDNNPSDSNADWDRVQAVAVHKQIVRRAGGRTDVRSLAAQLGKTKSTVARDLKIAKAITAEVLDRAGVSTEPNPANGQPSIYGFSQTRLLAITDAADVDERVRLLSAAPKAPTNKSAFQAKLDKAGRINGLSHHVQPEDMDPSDLESYSAKAVEFAQAILKATSLYAGSQPGYFMSEDGDPVEGLLLWLPPEDQLRSIEPEAGEELVRRLRGYATRLKKALREGQ